MTWDVVVAGAGPAGASAAHAAALTGARTLLLERAALPRYKRCGGGLVGASRGVVRLLEIDLGPLVRDVVGRVTFSHEGRGTFMRRAEPFLPMVQRAEFDAALVQRAVQAGAELRTGVTVRDFQPSGAGVQLVTSAGELQAGAVVAADGSASRAAQVVGVACDQVDLGLEVELPMPRGADWSGRAHLDWGPVPGSYGWVFPKGDSLTVGVIGCRSRGADLTRYLDAFLTRLGLDRAGATEDGGHLTRVRAHGSPLRAGRLLVAGDAAGLLEPWTREGISFALRSGALAGAAAAGDVTGYERAVAGALGPEMAAGRTALAVFAAHPGLVHHALRWAPGRRSVRGWLSSGGGDRSRWPLFDLFVQVTAGESGVAEQLGRPGVARLARMLARQTRS